RPLVIRADPLVRLRPAELPGQFAPEGPDHGPIGFGDGVAGRDLVPDEDDTPHRGKLRRPRLLEHAVDPEEFGGWDAGEEVVEGEHRVRLPAAEVGLELDDRVAARPRQSPDRADEELPKTLGQEGATVELRRVTVLRRALAQVHLPE